MEELLKNETVRAKIKGLSPPVKVTGFFLSLFLTGFIDFILTKTKFILRSQLYFLG